MIKHIVMWTLKEFAEGAGKAENARTAKAKLEALNGVIPGLRHLEVGINFDPSPDAFDIVLYSEFETLADLQAYQTHPAHLAVGDFVGQVRIDRRVVDYEG